MTINTLTYSNMKYIFVYFRHAIQISQLFPKKKSNFCSHVNKCQLCSSFRFLHERKIHRTYMKDIVPLKIIVRENGFNLI